MDQKANIYTLESTEESTELASKIAASLKPGDIVCLYGDLGAGKTHFCKGIAEGLGISSFSIKSPTYTYMRQYELPKAKLFHIDLYRIEQLDELLEEELQEIIDNPKNIALIEWADRMESILPQERIAIKLEYLGPESRKASIDDRR